MKYKVGDKVIVRSDLNEDVKYNGMYPVDDMVYLKGEVVTIIEIIYDCEQYKIREDGNLYYWKDDMFQGLATDEQTINAIETKETLFNPSAICEVVGHFQNMIENNIIQGYGGGESFEGWCEDGDVFEGDEVHIAECKRIMNLLSPIINSFNYKVDEIMGTSY